MRGPKAGIQLWHHIKEAGCHQMSVPTHEEAKEGVYTDSISLHFTTNPTSGAAA